MKDFLLVAGLLAAPASVSVQQYKASPVVKQNDPRLSRLQKYFGDRDCPLRDSAKDFLVAADQNHLDWRLLPSISIIESSGGKDYKNNNVFGWASCKEKFTSVRAGIHYVAAQLGKSRRYKDKDIDSKLQLYNPVPEYSQRVKAVMRAIGTRSQPRVLAAD
ncbi:MAG TPA: hypothetical protein VK708_00330 [Bryobacteraceae bacterium]|jgi:hypothetical protein|nr:hypothetical protein [Bryobacteraceae bacterium]